MATFEPETKDTLLLKAERLFRSTFDHHATVAAFAPGRVNLIGEHTDYTNGFVCPMALNAGTVVAGTGSLIGIEGSEDPSLLSTVVSLQKPEEPAVFECSPALRPASSPKWANYVKGVLKEYLDDVPAGKRLVVNMAVASSVPLGSGLSSSASLEVAVATFVERITGKAQPLVTRALRCQSAEHNFTNTPCGIMDQFISTMALQGSALLIDCASNKVLDEVTFSDDSFTILVCNSGVKHQLGTSEYPTRVQQCRDAEKALRQRFGQKNFPRGLRDATTSMIEDLRRANVLDDVHYRRAKHVVTENERCQAYAACLSTGNFEEAGRLMNESHKSLRDDYEVSCSEIDVLVNLAQTTEGVVGSRMTGGGFGGCTVTLVRTSKVQELEQYLHLEYRSRVGKNCITFSSQPGPGAHSVQPTAWVWLLFHGPFVKDKAARRTFWMGFTVAVAVISAALAYAQTTGRETESLY